MPHRLTPLALLASVLLIACGSGGGNGLPATPAQPLDPKSAPSATLPAVLPSPIPAGATGTVGPGGSSNQPGTYTVKQGDTLSAIAQQFGVSVQDLLSYNSGVNANSLRIGQDLKLPPAPSATAAPGINIGPATSTPSVSRTATTAASRSPSPAATRSTATGSPPATSTSRGSTGGPQTYTVKSGDTACKIATNSKVSLQELSEANHTTIAGLAQLKVGQQLQIPAATGSPPGC